MPKTNCLLMATLLCVWALQQLPAAERADRLHALMPRSADFTAMWWADGFPGHTPSAPWHRVIQTGHYVMVLDTQRIQIPHIGSVGLGTSYGELVRSGDEQWRALPPVALTLTLTVDGIAYRCVEGGSWTSFTGPRLIESGRFLQRADVTNLVFLADDGTKLNVEARFETVAWPDRLTLILAARPGHTPIPPGEVCFGRLGGGFGLDGTNHWEIPHSPELDPEQFTLEFWTFVPEDCQASERTFPWLACKNHHEQAEGNYGIVVLHGRPQARLNIGGGRDNMFFVDSPSPLHIDAWNHLAMSYDGNTLRLFLNGELAGERGIGRRRVPGQEGLAFGRRQDNCGDGYHFRGVVDEIRLYDRALTAAEVRARHGNPEQSEAVPSPIRAWSFDADGTASMKRPSDRWRDVSMEIRLAGVQSAGGQEELHSRWALSPDSGAADPEWSERHWREVHLTWDPATAVPLQDAGGIRVEAFEHSGGAARPVDFDPARGWHRVDLNGIEPLALRNGVEAPNDAIERVRLVLTNTCDREQTARLLFDKDGAGIRQRIGSPITGMSAVLRDLDGHPTGIPVQLSKNWHTRPEGGVYAGTWFHGISQVRLPPGARKELELTLAYGHWGGVAAASHSQLCLIGWGSNQLWDQSAMGSWGESICYEPDQIQADCTVLDVRPLMVRSMAADQPWHWTHNVGGGDFFRLFSPSGERIAHAPMRTAYERYGPCLTEVTYAGRVGPGIEHAVTASLARTDDIVRGVYRIRMDVKQSVDFSRFVIFQIGADSYSYTGERKIAVGDESGLAREWETQWGGGTYRTLPIECSGRLPWVSLHEAVSRAEHEARGRGQPGAPGAWANRGLVIRHWQARLGGQPALPFVAEHGVHARGHDTSTIDIIPPTGVTRLEPGDFVEATIEHLVMPQFAADYYGPNRALRAALTESQDSWRMVHREAVGNDRRVTTHTGTLERLHPAITIRADRDAAEFQLSGGLGYVPITITGLRSSRDYDLLVDGHRVDQSVHGRDFWQTDYDPSLQRWSRTYTLPVEPGRQHTLRLVPGSGSRKS